MSRIAVRLRAVAARVFAEQTMTRVIDPILADQRCEYEEARARGQLWRARVTLVRGYVALAHALLSLGGRAAVDPRSDAARTVFVAAIAAAVIAVPLVAAPLVEWPFWRSDPVFGARLFATVIPQALPLSLPAGLCLAVLWAMRGRTATWRRAGTVLAVALAFTAAVWTVLEWAMPRANQGFREMIAARLAPSGRAPVLEPGLNELGLSRLAQRGDAEAERHAQQLWALCFASTPLSLLALGLARRVRRRTSAVALGIVLSNAYFALLWTCAALAAGSAVPASVPAWTPNLLVLLAASVLIGWPLRSTANART